MNNIALKLFLAVISGTVFGYAVALISDVFYGVFAGALIALFVPDQFLFTLVKREIHSVRGAFGAQAKNASARLEKAFSLQHTLLIIGGIIIVGIFIKQNIVMLGKMPPEGNLFFDILRMVGGFVAYYLLTGVIMGLGMLLLAGIFELRRRSVGRFTLLPITITLSIFLERMETWFGKKEWKYTHTKEICSIIVLSIMAYYAKYWLWWSCIFFLVALCFWIVDLFLTLVTNLLLYRGPSASIIAGLCVFLGHYCYPEGLHTFGDFAYFGTLAVCGGALAVILHKWCTELGELDVRYYI